MNDGNENENYYGPEAPGYALVTIPSILEQKKNEKDGFSDKHYNDITFSFETNSTADIEIEIRDEKLKIKYHGKSVKKDNDSWRRIKKDGIIGLLDIPIEKIIDPTQIIKVIPNERIDHYFVIYYGNKPDNLSNSDILSLAKLRAIENRVGVLILTDVQKEALKTNNYKNIQRFKERNGIYGFNLKNLGGPDSVFTAGIPKRFKENYYDLL